MKLMLIITAYTLVAQVAQVVALTNNNDIVDDLIIQLSKLVNHYVQHEDGVNVDGLYGLRIAQGKQ